MTAIVTKAILRGIPKVIEYARKDLEKRFSLLEPWELRLVEPVPAEYVSETLHVEGRTLVVKPYTSTADYPVCDGNTLVPEEVLGMPTVIGSLVHDPLYRELPQIARAFGWSVRKTRKWADTIYGNILIQLARRQEDRLTRRIGMAWAHASYAGVRVFGGLARWCYRLGLVLLFAAMLSGCSGCMGEVVDGFDSPVYEQTGGE